MSQEKNIIIYNEECPACLNFINKLKKKDANNYYGYIPKQSNEALQFPQLKEYTSGLRLIDKTGKVHVGANVLDEISKNISGYKVLSKLYRIPGFGLISRKIYNLFAKKRSL